MMKGKNVLLADTPLADAKLGTLAYYAPWGDVQINKVN